jgi:superfamily II DNA or RNA helicase
MIIKDKLYINIQELGPNLNSICREFTYKNPDYLEKKKQKFSVKGIDKYICYYKLEASNGNTILTLPRGGLSKVIKICESLGITLQQIDRRVEHKKIDFTLTGITLDKNQHRIINKLIENEGGLIEAPPALGKTIAMLGLIDKVKQPTLIILPYDRISKQWFEEFEKCKGGYILGQLDGFVKKDGDIVLGIINSVYNRFNEDPSYFDKFGMIIIDETHKLASNMYISVINNLSAKYRIGVSGTVDRRDGKQILIYDILGDKLLDIEENEAKNRITNFEFDVINTNVKFEIPTKYRWTGKKREWMLDNTKCIEVLTTNVERNNLIIERVINDIEMGYFPLILSDRIAHNELLYEHITSLGYKSILIIGKTRNKAKWKEIQTDKSIQCIIANTKIASEALNIPRLSSLFVTCPTSNLPKVKQQIGRIRRQLEGKQTPVVHDICDNLAYIINDKGTFNLLQKMAIKRIKFYRQLQFEYESTLEPEGGEEVQTVV